MRRYEGMFIIKADIEQSSQDKVVNSVNETVVKNGGKVMDSEKMGKRRLAYPIKGNREGFYYRLDFEMEPRTLSVLKRDYKLNEGIIRELIVVKE